MSGNSMSSPVVLVRTLQIIIGAMVAGCGMFLVIVLVIAGGSSKVSDPPVITYLACTVAAAAVVAHLIIPGIVVAQARRKIVAGTWNIVQRNQPPTSADGAEQDDVGKLTQWFMVRTIIVAVILEGPVFFLLVAHMLEHSPLSLVLAVVLILALAAQFPTHSRVDRWIEDQTRLLNEERQLAG